jgi:hypothetical protein
VLRRPLFRELILQNVGQRPNQHGTYAQIPAEHGHKPVVTALRNPYTRLISQYRFWIQQRFTFLIPEARWRAEFPAFPELSLEEYLRMREIALAEELRGVPMRVQAGHQTVEFVRMFFREPESALRRLDEEYVASGRFREDMPAITFLRTEELNRELYDFLAAHGFAEERIAFILDHQKMNVTRAASEKKDALWTPAAIEHVQERERLLFAMLERLGFTYAAPAALHV